MSRKLNDVSKDVWSRIEEVEKLTEKFLSSIHLPEAGERFVARAGRPIVKHTVLVTMRSLGLVLNNQLSNYLDWRPVVNMRELTQNEINWCMKIVRILLESYAQMAKPSTCFRSTVLANTNDRLREKVVVESKAWLAKVGERVPVVERLKAEVFSHTDIDPYTIYTILKLARVMDLEMFNTWKSSTRDLPATHEEDTLLQQYVDQWNAENNLVKISRGEYLSSKRSWTKEPHFTLSSGKVIIHNQRRKEAYLLDGLPVYSYESFKRLMEVDTWKAAINSPGLYINPQNYEQFSRGGVVAEIATQDVRLDPSKYTVIRIRKGDQEMFESKYVFFESTKDGYKRILADEDVVKVVRNRMNLAKKLIM